MSNNNNTSTTSGYRAIVPAPPMSSMIPISPHHSPQTHPSPQHGISLPPPFGTPPVSPFSHPMNNGEYLPPPLAPLPPMMSSLNLNAPPSPTNGRYVLPKQAPSTSVFTSAPPIPMTPSNMQHHSSIIHSYPPPHHQKRVSLSGAATGATTADQRELARKVSHSAIERRRRERINDKIMQLKELIPSCADQDHLHKLNILQSAIEYIQYLQGCVAESRGNNAGNGNSEERFMKRSKFDRYEIPIPKKVIDNSKNGSDKSNNEDNANANTKSEEKESVNHEEAKALLLLSKSTSTMTTTTNDVASKRIPETRDVEIQTSFNMNETEIEYEYEGDEDDDDDSAPTRGGMTVQQLLC